MIFLGFLLLSFWLGVVSTIYYGFLVDLWMMHGSCDECFYQFVYKVHNRHYLLTYRNFIQLFNHRWRNRVVTAPTVKLKPSGDSARLEAMCDLQDIIKKFGCSVDLDSFANLSLKELKDIYSSLELDLVDLGSIRPSCATGAVYADSVLLRLNRCAKFPQCYQAGFVHDRFHQKCYNRIAFVSLMVTCLFCLIPVASAQPIEETALYAGGSVLTWAMRLFTFLVILWVLNFAFDKWVGFRFQVLKYRAWDYTFGKIYDAIPYIWANQHVQAFISLVPFFFMLAGLVYWLRVAMRVVEHLNKPKIEREKSKILTWFDQVSVVLVPFLIAAYGWKSSNEFRKYFGFVSMIATFANGIFTFVPESIQRSFEELIARTESYFACEDSQTWTQWVQGGTEALRVETERRADLALDGLRNLWSSQESGEIRQPEDRSGLGMPSLFAFNKVGWLKAHGRKFALYGFLSICAIVVLTLVILHWRSSQLNCTKVRDERKELKVGKVDVLVKKIVADIDGVTIDRLTESQAKFEAPRRGKRGKKKTLTQNYFYYDKDGQLFYTNISPDEYKGDGYRHYTDMVDHMDLDNIDWGDDPDMDYFGVARGERVHFDHSEHRCEQCELLKLKMHDCDFPDLVINGNTFSPPLTLVGCDGWCGVQGCTHLLGCTDKSHLIVARSFSVYYDTLYSQIYTYFFRRVHDMIPLEKFDFDYYVNQNLEYDDESLPCVDPSGEIQVVLGPGQWGFKSDAAAKEKLFRPGAFSERKDPDTGLKVCRHFSRGACAKGDDCKYLHVPPKNKRKRGKPSSPQQEMMQPGNNIFAVDKTGNSVFEVKRSENEKRIVHASLILGNRLVFNSHAFDNYGSDSFVIYHPRSKWCKEFSRKRDLRFFSTDGAVREGELVACLDFSKWIQEMKFSSLKIRPPVDGEQVSLVTFNDTGSVNSSIGVVHKRADGYWTYNVSTLPGHCGAPVLAADGKMVGYHVAGSAQCNYFIPIDFTTLDFKSALVEATKVDRKLILPPVPESPPVAVASAAPIIPADSKNLKGLVAPSGLKKGGSQWQRVQQPGTTNGVNTPGVNTSVSAPQPKRRRSIS